MISKPLSGEGKGTMSNILARISVLCLVFILLLAPVTAVTSAARASAPLNVIFCDAFSVGDKAGEIRVGEPISFFSTVFNLNGAPLQYDYLWNLGEGSPRASDSVVWTYASEGSKTVSLFVSEKGNPSNSCFDTVYLNVLPQLINNPPLATIFLTSQRSDELY